MNKKESTLLNKGDIQQPYDSQTRETQILDQIGIWKFVERRKPKYPEKNLSEQGKRTNKPFNPHTTQSSATSVGREVLSPHRHACLPEAKVQLHFTAKNIRTIHRKSASD